MKARVAYQDRVMGLNAEEAKKRKKWIEINNTQSRKDDEICNWVLMVGEGRKKMKIKIFTTAIFSPLWFRFRTRSFRALVVVVSAICRVIVHNFRATVAAEWMTTWHNILTTPPVKKAQNNDVT